MYRKTALYALTEAVETDGMEAKEEVVVGAWTSYDGQGGGERASERASERERERLLGRIVQNGG